MTPTVDAVPQGQAATAAASRDLRHPLMRIDFDAVLTCWAFISGLFPIYLKSLTGVFFLLIPGVFFIVRMERVMPFLKRSWPVLLIPALAVLSTTWSVLPKTTLYYSLQFTLTVLVGTIVGVGMDRRQALLGAFAAFLFHGGLTFLYGVKAGALQYGGEYAFVGFAGSKNTTADMGCMGLLVAIAAMGMALRERKLILFLLAGGLILIDAYMILCARSAGALAAVSVASLVLITMLASGRLAPAVRFSALGLLLIVVIAAAATQQLWFHAFFEKYLHAAGKDDSLTGRTYIWSRALVLIHHYPLLGRGFLAFWQVGDLESEAIWAKLLVAERAGFNFHNSVYELEVYLGYVGLIFYSAIAILCIVTLLVRTAIRIRPMACLCCAFLVYDGMRFQFEAIPLGIFSHNVILLYASFAAAFAAAGRPETANYMVADPRLRRPIAPPG